MFSHHFAFLRRSILIAAITIPSWGDSPIRIDSVSPEYTPTAGPEMPERVSVEDYSFEVEPETGRARVVIDYTYPDEQAFNRGGGAGPRPTKAQLPGLKYDAAAGAIVYEQGGKKTVCATVRDRRFLSRKSLSVRPTGACVVTSRLTIHNHDTGWAIRRVPVLDTYLELR